MIESPNSDNLQVVKLEMDVFQYPIPSMYGIFTYIWLFFFMVNVGKYTIHGSYGHVFVEMFGSSLGKK